MKKKIFGVLAAIGVILIFGAVGKADYMDEIGEYYTFASIAKWGMVGIFLMIPYAINNVKEMATECEKSNLKTR